MAGTIILYQILTGNIVRNFETEKPEEVVSS